MNKPFKLTIPSKTFLCGEYAVLCQKPARALVLNTSPSFIASINRSVNSSSFGMNPHSPFLHLIQDQQVSIDFSDPHQNLGGFGCSGAEFITCYEASLTSSIEKSPFTYWDAYKAFISQKNSGCDVLSQLTGKVALIDCMNRTTRALDWPFKKIDFVIVRTNIKIQTHEALDHKGEHDFESLKPISETIIEAFLANKPSAFLQGIDAYSTMMRELNLVHENTSHLTQLLSMHQAVKAVKGCGALGADTILLFYAPEEAQEIRTILANLNLRIIANQQSLCSMKKEAA